jgi:signal transduction histidine kinase
MPILRAADRHHVGYSHRGTPDRVRPHGRGRPHGADRTVARVDRRRRAYSPRRSTGHLARWTRPKRSLAYGVGVTSTRLSRAAAHWPRLGNLPVWAVPLVVLFFQLMGSTGAHEGAAHGTQPFHPTPLDLFAHLLLVVGPMALLARRHHPVATLLVVSAITLLYYLRAYVYGPAFLAAAVAMTAAVTAGHRRVVWIGTSAGLTGFFTLSALVGLPAEQAGAASDRVFPMERPTLLGTSFVLAWMLVVLTSAEIVRIRSEKAAQTARTQEEEGRRRASEERLRIARELHDVLAHNISMINVQAGVALHLMDDRPEQARTALAAIKEASKEALSEMRSVIGVLRQQGENAPRAPTVGLARLDELVDRARSAGLDVHTKIDGTVRPLPAGVDLAAFRIAQESLTNVTRHAGTGPVTTWVRIAYGERDIEIEVGDEGRGAALLAEDCGGSGLPGMRERAMALGGEFSAGPKPGGGFRVWARLPFEEDE